MEDRPETNGKAVQIARLEEQMKFVQSDLTEIKSNHLPHIYNSLSGLTEQINSVKVSISRYIGIGIGAVAVFDVVIRILFGK